MCLCERQEHVVEERERVCVLGVGVLDCGWIHMCLPQTCPSEGGTFPARVLSVVSVVDVKVKRHFGSSPLMQFVVVVFVFCQSKKHK